MTSEWQIRSIADFNGDRRQDLIWYSETTYKLSFWTMGVSPLDIVPFIFNLDLESLANAIKIEPIEGSIVNFPDIPESWSIAAIGNM